MQTTEAKLKEHEAQINAIQADNAVRTRDTTYWRESLFSRPRGRARHRFSSQRTILHVTFRLLL